MAPKKWCLPSDKTTRLALNHGASAEIHAVSAETVHDAGSVMASHCAKLKHPARMKSRKKKD